MGSVDLFVMRMSQRLSNPGEGKLAMKIALSNNRAVSGKIMQGDIAAWREFNGSFNNVELSPVEFMQRVQAGFAYTAQHNRYRHSDNFICGQHIALDMDTQDERSSIAVLSVDPFIMQYAAFIHTTPSHTVDKPKARVVFILDRPISNVKKYAELAQALVHRFDSSDRACKDPARFFYGAKGCDVAWLGNTLTLENAANELVLPYREHVAELERKAAEAAKNRVVVGNGDVPEAMLKKHSQSLLDRVALAADGEKYITLRDTAITFGGYVAGGYYSRSDVVSWLQNAIAHNPNNVQDKHAAFAAIEESVLYGMNRPLYFEVKRTAASVDDLSTVHPPLTDSQKEQVTKIISRKVWEAYHEGMTQAQREKWLQHGLDSNAVNFFNLGYCERLVNEETGEIVTQDALTVPYLDFAGNVVNVEYRGENVTYQNDNPATYYTDISDPERPLLILPDSISAMITYLQYGGNLDYTVAGLPSRKSTQGVERPAVVLLEPQTNAAALGLGRFKDNGRFARLPLPVSKMIHYGMGSEVLDRYIRQARRVS